jgi:hypothetical protein
MARETQLTFGLALMVSCAWRRLEQELLPQETLIAPVPSAWRTRNQKTRMMEMPPDAVDISLPSMLPEVAQRNQKL